MGPIWSSTSLTDPDGDGVYIASVPEPAQGWTGFFVQVSMGGFTLCSGLRVIPDTYYNGAPAPDITPPVLTLGAVTPRRIRPGETASFTISSSEPLLSVPELTVDNAQVTLISGNDQTWQYAVTVNASAPEGPLNARVTALDQAENPGEAQFPAVLTVDNTPPSLVSISAVPALARPGETVTFNLSVSEPLIDPPIVMAGSWQTILVQSGKSETDFIYQWTVPEESVPGEVPVTVEMTDEAGNTATETQTGLLEISAPLPLYGATILALVLLIPAAIRIGTARVGRTASI